MENNCTSYNFTLFAIFVPKIVRFGGSVVITKIICLFFETRCIAQFHAKHLNCARCSSISRTRSSSMCAERHRCLQPVDAVRHTVNSRRSDTRQRRSADRVCYVDTAERSSGAGWLSTCNVGDRSAAVDQLGALFSSLLLLVRQLSFLSQSHRELVLLSMTAFLVCTVIRFVCLFIYSMCHMAERHRSCT